MSKAWAVMDIGDTMVGSPFLTKEAAQAAIDGMSYFGDMLEVREIEVNDEPRNEETQELEDRLKEAMGNIVNFHMSKGPKFFEMSYNDRLRFMINMFTLDHLEEPNTEAPKSNVEPRDVRDIIAGLDD